MTGYDAGTEIFGVSQSVAWKLFYPGNGDGELGGSATPKQWAKFARQIVDKLKQGELE